MMSVIVDELRHTSEGLRYGFAVGKVRVLETRLLDRATLERLVDAQDFAEQKRVLSEGPYGRFLDQAVTAADVERAIDDALGSAYAFLDEAGLPAEVVRFFRLRFDYANVKAAVKARLFDADMEGLLSRHGTVARDLFSGPLDRLPEPLGSLATRLMEKDAAGESPMTVLDASVDRAMFSALRAVARDSKSAFLAQMAATMIDLANLKTIVRASAAGLEPEFVEQELLIEGGTVDTVELARIHRLSGAEAIAALERRLGLTGAPLSSAEDEVELDVVVDDALVAAVRRGRRPEPGADAVIAYVLAREAEAQVLRLALLGKLAGLDSAALHRRMRASFR